MIYKLFSDIETKVRADLGLVDETVAMPQSMIMGFCNDAIEIAEALIHNMNEDYFKTSDLVSLVTGVSSYAMPSNIYAAKLRSIIYTNGTLIYEVKPIQGPNLARKIADINQYGQSRFYEYDLQNDSAAAGVKMMLYPASRETSSTVMQRWYLREANRITASSDPVDIPEYHGYIVAYVKMMVARGVGYPFFEKLEEDVQNLHTLMVSTLSARKSDENNYVPMDTSFYEEHN